MEAEDVGHFRKGVRRRSVLPQQGRGECQRHQRRHHYLIRPARLSGGQRIAIFVSDKEQVHQRRLRQRRLMRTSPLEVKNPYMLNKLNVHIPNLVRPIRRPRNSFVNELIFEESFQFNSTNGLTAPSCLSQTLRS